MDHTLEPGLTRSAAASFLQVGATSRLLVLFSPDEAARGRIALLEGRSLRIGRLGHLAGPLAIDDPLLSREHAELRPDGDGGWAVHDLGSSNGTFLEGQRVSQATLASGAILRAGGTLLLYEHIELDPDTLLEPEVPDLLGPSVAMQRLRGELGLVAPRRVPVLILGESGVGKERVASELHRRSGREGPLVAVNCAAIPENLIESELFGHVEGAFSGATRARLGLFHEADGGTLFLDEVGEMPAALQPKLLRVLADGEVRRVGSTRSQRVDVRVVAATNVAIQDAIRRQDFRGDLYARLAGWVLEVPPLARRRQDILPLAQHFLERESPGLTLRGSTAEALLLHSWPYNVRELEQAMGQAAIRATDQGQVHLRHLPADLRATLPRSGSPKAAVPLALQVDRTATPGARELALVLRHYQGNLAQVAAFFGKDRRQVYRWIQRHGLDPAGFREG
ncbi:MAG: sigma 54-interacting transcriptional regulator [Pseudomonadota bacterium]